MRELQPILCSFFTAPRRRIVNRACDEWHLMLVLMSGCYEATVGAREIVARCGDVVILPMGTERSESNPPDDPPSMYIIHFRWDDFPENAPLVTHDTEGRVRLLAERLHDKWWTGVHYCEEYSAGIFHAILAEWLLLQEPVENVLLSSTRRFVMDHLAEHIALHDLSRNAQLSKTHFVRRFKAACGTTPMAEVRRIRVEYARTLLMTTTLPLKAIAAKVGVADEFSLSHLLKKHTGRSPSEIREGEG
jgi:AraC-like DNA-binding protein